ncbi:stage III sporulation protein AG [Bacillus massilinigeriensis]|uniref:stage III sporulation protein AG n=1 Tax=Bacillus massilionigeriensis TaxID=1805475 RepID=UPI00096B51AA|nr:stage III sporulation protein AG [Bacillus massilionigeriensis]
MSQDKGPLSTLKKLFSESGNGDKKKNKYQYLLLVLLFGAFIMVLSNLLFSGESNADLPVFNNQTNKEEDVPTFGQGKSKSNDLIKEYENRYENQLKEALEEINGVDDVIVVVNVDATEKKVLEKNTVTNSQTTEETDPQGGKRMIEEQSKDEQLVITNEGEKEGPIVVETKKPEIRGVLVVAKGAENVEVKGWIFEAVTRVLDVPMHRVSVLPKKPKGE